MRSAKRDTKWSARRHLRMGLSLVKSDPSHSAILLDWDLEGEDQFAESAALTIIREVRHRNKRVPIFLIADRTLVSELPLEVIRQVHEYIHLFGDTPAFIASRVDFAVERYEAQLLPPYFKALKEYNDQGAYSWDAPGHMGGVAFLKHPVGMEFHKLFWRKHHALGSGDFDFAAGVVAGPYWASGRERAECCANLWCGLDFLCAGRIVHFEPDCRAWCDGAG